MVTFTTPFTSPFSTSLSCSPLYSEIVSLLLELKACRIPPKPAATWAVAVAAPVIVIRSALASLVSSIATMAVSSVLTASRLSSGLSSWARSSVV